MLWLVTPVHGRESLTRLCFEQRARMLAELATLGVEARQLVVGDDANVGAAHEFGFTVLRRDNVLGWRVNEGFEWACREGGATHVAYCGSDDWHLAAFFADLPNARNVRASHFQAFVPPEGNRLIALRATAAVGGAPWIIPAALLEPCGYRPSRDDAMNGIDSSIADGVLLPLAGNARGGRIKRRRAAFLETFVFDNMEPLRMVDFKAGGEQVTPWHRVKPRDASRVLVDTREPWAELATRYPVDLVERMQKFYAEKEAQ